MWLAAVRTELRADKKKEAEVLIAKALQVRPAAPPRPDTSYLPK